jgi:crossover junction endodeoxyribonuclease RuvC
MFDSRVLGVDPGVARMGLAVVARHGSRADLIWSDAIRTASTTDDSVRLQHLSAAMREAIRRHSPTAVALERIAFRRNTVSALTVARVTGAIMAVAAEEGVPVSEYSPTEVKDAVTGMGNADKQQIRTALARVHRLTGVPSQPDAADAVAVAVAHLAAERLRAAVARSGAR